MTDWTALTGGFQGGAKFTSDIRKARQYEKARDQALELGEYDLQSKRKFRKTENPEVADVLGEGYAAGNTDWASGLGDPMGAKLWKKFQGWRANRNANKNGASAIDIGVAPQIPESAFSNTEEVDTGLDVGPGAGMEFESPDMQQAIPMADGGLTEEQIREVEKRNARELRNARYEVGKDRVKTGARNAVNRTREAAKYKGVAPKGTGFLKGTAGMGAAAAGIAGALQSADTDTEEYADRFGFDWMRAKDDDTPGTRFARDLGTRAIGTMVDVGNQIPGVAWLTGADDEAPPQAPKRQAIPVEGTPNRPMQLSTTTIRGSRGRGAPAPAQDQPVDFSDLDVDPKDIPDMKTDDWKRYRAQMMEAAQASGDPDSVGKAHQMVTEMQQRNFMNYGQQGLALQQAGNVRGAMAAYRAAFQYFPNGYDVEFGTHKNPKTGKLEIVGFGRDENTGKQVAGSEIVMDPARVTAMMENFAKPGAWNMWVKDQKDFQQQLRQYEEVTKPVAQNAMDVANRNAEANYLQAQNYGLGRAGAGGMKQSDIRAAQEMFAGIFMEQGVTDQEEALQLGTFAIQLKQRMPNLSENEIAQAVLQRRAQMGNTE